MNDKPLSLRRLKPLLPAVVSELLRLGAHLSLSSNSRAASLGAQMWPHQLRKVTATRSFQVPLGQSRESVPGSRWVPRMRRNLSFHAGARPGSPVAVGPGDLPKCGRGELRSRWRLGSSLDAGYDGFPDSPGPSLSFYLFGCT